MKGSMTWRNWLPLLGLTCSAFVFNTSEFIPIALLTDIAADFSTTEAHAGLLISVYAWVVWLPSLPQSVEDMQFLSHEIFHAVCAIMIGIGVPLSDDSEEAYAYLTGYITRKVLEAFPISFSANGRDTFGTE